MHCSHRTILPFLPSNSSCFHAEIGLQIIFAFLCLQPCSVACLNLCGSSGSAVSLLLPRAFRTLPVCLSVPSPLYQLHVLPYPKLVPCHKSFLALPVAVPSRGLQPKPVQLTVRCSLLVCGRSGLTLTCSSNYFSDKMYFWQRQ